MRAGVLAAFKTLNLSRNRLRTSSRLSHLPESVCRAILTPFQRDGTAGNVESAPHSLFLQPRCAQFDLNCAAVLAHDTVALAFGTT